MRFSTIVLENFFELVFPLCFLEYNCTTSQGEYLYKELTDLTHDEVPADSHRVPVVAVAVQVRQTFPRQSVLLFYHAVHYNKKEYRERGL